MIIGGMGQHHISDYYHNLPTAIREDLASESDNNIVNTDSKELEDYYFQKYALPEIILDPDRPSETKPTRLTHEVVDLFGEPAVQETNAAEVVIHLVPGNNLETALECEASTWTTYAVDGRIQLLEF
ncbi:MAG: hypothetical protein UT61_C0016G0012 [Candidatus Woesebacteria bacterium GW2011_GWA1_39_8]|uniref:Uncharacterized protein n=1 Tax=Candidatus Woesebacteria bacterium GW2011_GWA1_39_8 TaxID=1618552 RepID=A0A0G0PY09_9BACT|nr:MAG: hypothetical protein UT61_C0016G0012 [Candidatus Woesebacteria bacterium GW2011_GWA1_39_8]